MIELEEQLIRKCDLLIVSAARLLESKGAKPPRTVLVRHGVEYEHFRIVSVHKRQGLLAAHAYVAANEGFGKVVLNV